MSCPFRPMVLHMNRLVLCLAVFSTLTASSAFAQATDTQPVAQAPSGFSNFVGTWTLKDDKFEQVWDGYTVETLSISNHMTVCATVTTASSLSCTVNAGDLTGQIFWVTDEERRTLHHLSHFGETRLGVGTGTIDGAGNLKNRVTFADEPEGTYRIYEYQWVSEDEYWMMSRQYDVDDQPTGNYYAGTFIRVSEPG